MSIHLKSMLIRPAYLFVLNQSQAFDSEGVALRRLRIAVQRPEVYNLALSAHPNPERPPKCESSVDQVVLVAVCARLCLLDAGVLPQLAERSGVDHRRSQGRAGLQRGADIESGRRDCD